MTIIAKPVIDKQFWILQDGDRKVGNIEACDGGYQVKIQNQTAQFKTIRMVAQRVNIHFESGFKTVKPKYDIGFVHGYSVSGRVHNPMWDVKMKVPIYTKTSKSKSWFADGWYRVRKGRNWHTVNAPKLIVLQRYDFVGPFYNEELANEHASTTIC